MLAQVFHECAWGCRGQFVPARYNSSRAKCIKCRLCGVFFSPNKVGGAQASNLFPYQGDAKKPKRVTTWKLVQILHQICPR